MEIGSHLMAKPLAQADGERIALGNTDFFSESPSRGWFVGSFLDPEAGLRESSDLEVKWCRHAEGEKRPTLSTLGATSIAILVQGAFQFKFPGEEPDRVVLQKQGDYVLYGRGVTHSWTALTDSIVITIRWPSIACDAAPD
jgi:hypothetical protein